MVRCDCSGAVGFTGRYAWEWPVFLGLSDEDGGKKEEEKKDFNRGKKLRDNDLKLVPVPNTGVDEYNRYIGDGEDEKNWTWGYTESEEDKLTVLKQSQGDSGFIGVRKGVNQAGKIFAIMRVFDLTGFNEDYVRVYITTNTLNSEVTKLEVGEADIAGPFVGTKHHVVESNDDAMEIGVMGKGLNSVVVTFRVLKTGLPSGVSVVISVESQGFQ
jgi:hypothetical protein